MNTEQIWSARKLVKGGKRLDIEKVNGQGSGQTGGDVSVQVLPANKAQNRTIQERKKRKKKKAGAQRILPLSRPGPSLSFAPNASQ